MGIVPPLPVRARIATTDGGGRSQREVRLLLPPHHQERREGEPAHPKKIPQGPCRQCEAVHSAQRRQAEYDRLVSLVFPWPGGGSGATS
jgi:hypothetical protein